MVVNPVNGTFPTKGIKKWLDAEKTKLNPKYKKFAVVKQVGQCVLAKGAQKKCQVGEMLARGTATRADKKTGDKTTVQTFRCVKTLPEGHTKVANGTLPMRHRLPAGLKHHDPRENVLRNARRIAARRIAEPRKIIAAAAKKDLHATHVKTGAKINLTGKKCPDGYTKSKTNATKCEANPTAYMTVAEKKAHAAEKKALAKKPAAKKPAAAKKAPAKAKAAEQAAAPQQVQTRSMSKRRK